MIKKVVHHKITEEQKECINAAKSKYNLKIKAFAGSGKTTTLVEIAKRLEGNGLYIAFNKSIQNEATKKFSYNVDCRTAHSLAYQASKEIIHNRIEELTMTYIKDLLCIKGMHGYEPLEISFFILKLLRVYCNTDRETIDESFASHGIFNIIRAKPYSKYQIISYIIEEAKKYWQKCWMKDSSLPIEHDFYLKIYQLFKPDLSKTYQYILFDECQDASPVMLDIVTRQSCQKIYVGDEHQQIYEWRGAINAFNNIEGETYYLSQSFRFGEEIADKANIITKIKGEEKLLRGLECVNSQITSQIPEIHTRLCRTNSRIIQCVIDNPKIPMHIIGGNTEVINLAKSGYALYKNNIKKVRDKKLKQFRSWEIMKEFNKKYEDPDITFLISIISKYGNYFYKIILELESANYVNEDCAKIILSTIHKSKGREWDNVVVEDDFLIFKKESKIKYTIINKIEELNLMYVAITRAKKKLLLISLFNTFLYKLKEELKSLDVQKNLN